MSGLSILSRVKSSDIVGVMLFACGERLAIWSAGPVQIVDAATGGAIVTLASSSARLYSLEFDGPLTITVNHAGPNGPWADVELWDMVRGAPIATLFPALARIAEIEISRSAISCVLSRPQAACVRFDRSGLRQRELVWPTYRDCVLASADGPQTIRNFGLRAEDLLDPATGARIPLEAETQDLSMRDAYSYWTFDMGRAHLALYRLSGRARVWRLPGGSLVRGPWDDRDLRSAFFVGEHFVAVARDATFVTYTTSGEVVARGGLVDPETPRAAVVDDRHVAFRAPGGGVSVWNVHEGVEVVRLETIESFGTIDQITAYEGRIVVSDGSSAVVLQLV